MDIFIIDDIYNRNIQKHNNIFDFIRMKDSNSKLLDCNITHLENNLTCIECAKLILNRTNNNDCRKVLFLSDNTSPDYLREMVLIGFKELLKDGCYDFNKIPYLYESYNKPITDLYGKGMSYTKNLKDDDYNELNEDEIKDWIKNKKFDLIIYPHYTRSLLFLDYVKNYYEPSKIIMINGEDIDYNHKEHLKLSNEGYNVFFRELL